MIKLIGCGIGVMIFAILIGGYYFVMSAMLDLGVGVLLKNTFLIMVLEWEAEYGDRNHCGNCRRNFCWHWHHILCFLLLTISVSFSADGDICLCGQGRGAKGCCSPLKNYKVEEQGSRWRLWL